MISIDDFKKVELSVGKILSAEKIPNADKLLKLSVNFGVKTIGENTNPPSHQNEPPPLGKEDLGKVERDIRQIVSGIAMYFPDPAV